MVRVAGFEPAVFRSQAGRLTKLAHTHILNGCFAANKYYHRLVTGTSRLSGFLIMLHHTRIPIVDWNGGTSRART